MNERLTSEARVALIAAEHRGPIRDESAAELELLAELLAAPSTWAEPPAHLEDAVVRAVSNAVPVRSTGGASVRKRPRLRAALAVAATVFVVAAALGAVVMNGSRSTSDYAGNLRATALARGADASVEIHRTDAGFRVTLDARGLPSLAQGEYYEAWLRNAAGTLVPIGTFSSSDERVTLWSGVSPREFSTLSVTIESNDNNQTPSGRRVLIGTVHAR